MDDLTVQVLLSGLGAVMGYGTSLWQSRIRPWITATKFNDPSYNQEVVTVHVPARLAEASAQSWFVEDLPMGPASIMPVVEAWHASQDWLASNEHGDARLATAILRLGDAATPEEVMRALEALFAEDSVAQLLEKAVLVGAVKTPEPRLGPAKAPFVYDPEASGGSYAVKSEKGTLRVGRGLSEDPFRKDGLLPLVHLVAALDREGLLRLLKELQPIQKEQTALHSAVFEESGRVIRDHGRWSCNCTITNFGSQPFMIFAEGASIEAWSPRSGRVRLPCEVGKYNDDGSLETWTGAHMVAGTTTEEFCVVTERVQMDIPETPRLVALFGKRNAVGRVSIHVVGPDLPWRRSLRSVKVPFQ